MTRLSTTLAALLAALAISASGAEKPTQPWPLKRTIDLSSGFGDLRANRFHAGLDLRTGGQVGAKVYSPADGYVWRVKMSYRGYGKGLYVKGSDGCFYVFGHLNGFAPDIEKAVKRSQFREQRYYVDLYFPKDSIPVKQGELIAYSGQTGVGAPHLHFEKRSPDNVPLNPLTHGFKLDDRTPPTFERVGFVSRGVYPLSDDGTREKYVSVHRVNDHKFTFDEAPYIDEVFGVVADCYDRNRNGGMRESVYSLTLKVDGLEVYRVAYDSLPYEIGAYAGLIHDPDQLTEGRKRAVRLFHDLGHGRDASAPIDARSGIVGYDKTFSAGTHELEIVAEDVAGNASTLSGQFMWGGRSAGRDMVSELLTEYMQNPGQFNASVLAPMELLDYRAGESDLLFEIRDHRGTYWIAIPPALELRSDGGALVLSAARGDFFERLRKQGVWAVETTIPDRYTMPSDFSLGISAGDFFAPRYLLVREVDALPKTKGMTSNAYEILPENFPLKKAFTVAIKLDSADPRNAKAGLCWYDRSSDEWTWVDTTPGEPYVAAGPSLGGGMFAALIDDKAPTIRKLNLEQGHTYTNLQPTVRCEIDDELSGFEDDRDFDIRINGIWMLPQYDFETGTMVATLEKPLAPGKATLTMSATDRAGNKSERKVEFVVEKSSKNK